MFYRLNAAFIFRSASATGTARNIFFDFYVLLDTFSYLFKRLALISPGGCCLSRPGCVARPARVALQKKLPKTSSPNMSPNWLKMVVHIHSAAMSTAVTA
jgi:hypothetical protein